MTSTFFDAIELQTRQARNELLSVPQLSDALKGEIGTATYIAYLTQAYHHVRHTVPFLMATGARLQDRNYWMQEAIAEYIEEEQGHEKWILNDIEAAGGDRQSAQNATPDLSTQVLVAYNYDYITRKNPVGFLGMVYMLESTSISLATLGAETLQQSLGLPASAFTYLLSHGTVDEEHIVFYQKLVNRITNEEDKSAIIDVANNTFRLFANVLRSIPHNTEHAHAA